METESPRTEPTPSLTVPRVRIQDLLLGAEAVVILPTLNEEHGLERTLSEIPFDRFQDPNHRVVTFVIDGGSTDGTVAVAQRWGIPVFRQTTRGKGAAVLEALKWARDAGVAHAVLLDADATYPPQVIVPALRLLREGTGLVLGVRRPVGGPPRRLVDLLHRVGNVALSYLATVITGKPVLDICSGFWGVSTEMFERLGVGTGEFAIEAELVMKAVRAGVDVTQIPIEYRQRIGESKLHTFRDGGAIFLSILRFGGRAPSPDPDQPIPISPARELLSIGLIAESRSAVLQCAPEDFQLANRIGLLLDQGLPEARVRVRPEFAAAGAPSPPEGESLLVTLPVPGDERSSTLTVAIRPREKELTIRLRSPENPLPLAPAFPAVNAIRFSQRLKRSVAKSAAALGPVTSRMNFEPRRQQQTMLRANGFRVVASGAGRFSPRGGLP
jgi:Glycosyl transferase family 2